MIAIDISVADWLLFSLIGVIVGLDSVSWPQAMWSRPLVAGTLGGLLFGDPAAGCLVGAWLELVMSRHPPFGAARYPETGPAALTAGAALALSGAGSTGALLGAVLVGWMMGWVGMHSVAAVRAANERFVASPDLFDGRISEVVRRHRMAIRLDAGRAAVLSASLLVPSALFVQLMASLEPGGRGGPVTPVLAVAGLAGLTGMGARALGSRRGGWPALALGGGIGTVLVWVAS